MKTEPNYVRIRLDVATIAWLRRLEAVTGDKPAAMIASMLTQIRIDDEYAHDEQRTLN